LPRAVFPHDDEWHTDERSSTPTAGLEILATRARGA
jgi:hypothetical protein